LSRDSKHKENPVSEQEVVTKAVIEARKALIAQGIDADAADAGSAAADIANAINPSGSIRGRNALADHLAETIADPNFRVMPAPERGPVAPPDELPTTLADVYQLGYARGVIAGRLLARVDALAADIANTKAELTARAARIGGGA
jgi:hypothetical protein